MRLNLCRLIVKADLSEPKSSLIEKYREGRRVQDSDAYALSIVVEGPNEENPSISSDQEPDAGNDGRKLRSSSRGAIGGESVFSMRAVNTGTTSAAPAKSKRVFSAEEYEASCEGERELQMWYARHNGLLFLSKENIERYCNSNA